MGIEEAEYSVYSLLFLQRGRFCEVVFMTEGKPYISVILDLSPQISEYGAEMIQMLPINVYSSIYKMD